jgi:hypothetical protein
MSRSPGRCDDDRDRTLLKPSAFASGKQIGPACVCRWHLALRDCGTMAHCLRAPRGATARLLVALRSLSRRRIVPASTNLLRRRGHEGSRALPTGDGVMGRPAVVTDYPARSPAEGSKSKQGGRRRASCGSPRRNQGCQAKGGGGRGSSVRRAGSRTPTDLRGCRMPLLPEGLAGGSVVLVEGRSRASGN